MLASSKGLIERVCIIENICAVCAIIPSLETAIGVFCDLGRGSGSIHAKLCCIIPEPPMTSTNAVMIKPTVEFFSFI